ncbi:Uncharacterised protein [Mycobacterium tuberculosis]|nr:Uncharacterised protein [Mycobacterium tuberculosis]
MLALFQRELQLFFDAALGLGREAVAVSGPGGRAGPRSDHRRCGVAGLVGHVPRLVHPSVPQPRHQIQRHQAAGDLHDGQHDRHVGVEGHADAGQDCYTGGKCPCRVRPVIAGDRRPVDPAHGGQLAQQEVCQGADHEVQGEANHHEPNDGADVGRLDLGEFFAAVPTDGQQQIQG